MSIFRMIKITKVSEVSEVLQVLQDDSWFYDVLQKRQFIGGEKQTAEVGKYSYVQLLNPVASGVTVYCYSILASRDDAGILFLRLFDTALETPSTALSNMYLGEAAPNAEIWKQKFNAEQGTEVMQAISNAVTSTDMIKKPIVLGEGKGILVGVGIQNKGVTGSFEWIEV